MRLIKIRHIRCSEFAAYTYVFAPDLWSDELIQINLEEAQSKYFNAIKIAREKDPLPPGGIYGQPPYKDYPNKTVQEVLDIHEEQKKVIKKWQDRQRNTKRSFIEFLKDEGFIPIYEPDDDDVFEVNWGHNHGTSIDYSETELDTLPTPNALVNGPEEDFF